MGINPHTANRWVAHCMPLVILGALGFASWAFCALICVDYLGIYRDLGGTAVALLVAYTFLLTFLLTSYLRVVWTINTDPGLVPCGVGGGPPEKRQIDLDSEGIVDRNGTGREKRREGGHDGPGENDSVSFGGRERWFARSSHSKTGYSVGDDIQLDSGERLRTVPYASTISRSSRMGSRTPSPLPPESSSQPASLPQVHIGTRSNGLIEMPPPVGSYPPRSDFSISRPQSLAQWMLPKNLHEFYNMDAFICENDGLPRWCFHCNCWKPDRSHHCGELGRCVRKMDHFCPWVGGVVGETSFKFFYQTVCYGVLYCCYILVVTAIMVHDRGTREKSVPTSWMVLLVLASFFLLFCAGMTSTTTQFILRNTTTIDNLSAATKVYQIAIYDPYAPMNSRDSAYTVLTTTTENGTPILDRQISQLPKSNMAAKRITFPDEDPALVNMGILPRRTFVIAKTEPGENPWRLERRIDNFKEVMGETVWDWFFPIRMSPCVTRNTGKDPEAMAVRREGMYKFNPSLMERLRRECGIGAAGSSPVVSMGV